MILLQRIDPAQNMRRYYGVRITTDLFGQFGLERAWGRIGKGGQRMCEWFNTRKEATAARRRLVRAKIRKGYRFARQGGR